MMYNFEKLFSEARVIACSNSVDRKEKMLANYATITEMASDIDTLSRRELELACYSANQLYLYNMNADNRLKCDKLYEGYIYKYGFSEGVMDSYLFYLSISLQYECLSKKVRQLLDIESSRIFALNCLFSYKELIGEGWFNRDEYLEYLIELSKYNNDPSLKAEIAYYSR